MGLNVSIKIAGVEEEALNEIKSQYPSDVPGEISTLDELRDWILGKDITINPYKNIYDAYSRLNYDGQMRCNYCYFFNDPDLKIDGKTEYSEVIDSTTVSDKIIPIMLNYKDDNSYNISDPSFGITLREANLGGYSFYRREYNEYSRYNGMKTVNVDGAKTLVPYQQEYTYLGDWKPAAVLLNKTMFRDFNIESGHSYQYVMYPANADSFQVFANYDAETGSASTWGEPVVVNWADWSIAELIPIENLVNTPSIKATYKVDLNNVWKFKYSLETGDQKQNLVKTQIQTLGKHPKISHGNYNTISGSVRCLLGSEIIPYTYEGYIERTQQSAILPISTDDRIAMMNKWRAFAFSKNPKLLRDIKGQSWIVQILDSSNTPYNFYSNQPDTISFSWIQIDSTDNMIIYGDMTDLPQDGCLNKWEPKYK